MLARDISLSLPIDCTLGQTCYIQNFVDADPSNTATDFTCGNLTYNNHKGTDFALPTHAHMFKKVDVLAAISGTVLGTRDGMEDHVQSTVGAPDVTGRECGNGLTVDNGHGWTTQYCHMMKGSITAGKGDHIREGAVLGQVGLSGKTEFPHVHFMVRKNGEVIDPFNPTASQTCQDTGAQTLWKDIQPYQSTGILAVGITDAVPEYGAIKAGTSQATLTTNSAAIVVFGFAFGGQKDDIMRLSITGPAGAIILKDAKIDKPQAQYFRAVGRKSSKPWPVGNYQARVQIIRNNIVISDMSDQTTIAP
jgi:hypothetical protein